MPRGPYTLEQQAKALLKAARKTPKTATELAKAAGLKTSGRGCGRALAFLVKEKKLVKSTGTVDGNRAPRYAKV
jgi:hypothetical protein